MATRKEAIMDPVAVLRGQFTTAHGILEGTVQDVTSEQAQWLPPGIANPLGATYAHIIVGEDRLLNEMVRGDRPMFASSWAGKTGLSALPPARDQGSWDAWARSVEIDLPTFRQYAQAVYANTDQYLASLNGDDMERELDLSAYQLGKRAAGWFLGNIMLSHVHHHCGEISCLKGLQGAKGYPF
jgi:hypothetical protein